MQVHHFSSVHYVGGEGSLGSMAEVSPLPLETPMIQTRNSQSASPGLGYPSTPLALAPEMLVLLRTPRPSHSDSSSLDLVGDLVEYG